MELKYKDMLKALDAIESERKIPEEVVISALKEAMVKAYKKNAELQDINVECEINDEKGTIDIYQLYTVVEEVEDDELEISVKNARFVQAGAKLGDVIRRKVEITSMSRPAATLARNVLKQKIREAEKDAIYNEYISLLNEMVQGVVESVKDKFILINLGHTVAMMPRSQEIPQENLREGQLVRVVINEVNRDTKGSQVLVSRADAMLVRRLFEKEVPEIYEGVVEIKAIARNAGERTKMAVFSHQSEVDPIGACIGPRGQRVSSIINELHGEKIDIFLWSKDVTQLVKNALAPAEIEHVILGEDGKNLIVIVREDQLSLAIGKKGKNAQLAYKLIGRKIDIKVRKDIEDQGYDFDTFVQEGEERRIKMLEEITRKDKEKLDAENKLAEQRRLEQAKKSLLDKVSYEESDELIPEEMQEAVSEKILTEMETSYEPDSDDTLSTVAPVEKEEPVVEEVEEEPKESKEEEKSMSEVEHKSKRVKADLESIAKNNTYVSVFEKLADTSKPKQESKPKRKKRKDEDEFKTRNTVLEKQLKKDFSNNLKPVYSEEELEEIERLEMEEEESQYDTDYDEYEDYYEEND